MIDLQGQTAVVTGGGRGLGRAFAETLAKAGASVAAIARSREELDETVAAIGARAQAFVADVSDAAAMRDAFRRIGPVDVLVNNAGMLGPIGPFAEADFDEWWRTLEVNLRGAMLAMHAALPHMLERRRGRIINIVTGAFSAPYLSPYLTSKTALVRATECLALETKAQGLALFSMAPGTVRTEMTKHSLTSEAGKKWIPWFRRIFDEGLDLPAERPAAVVLALASGKYDALSGLYVTPFDDLDALARDREQIDKEKQHSLQLHTRQAGAPAAAIASIRSASREAGRG